MILLRTICYFAVFPGSVKIWRKWLESYFRKEIANATYNRIDELRICVEAILHKNSPDFTMNEVLTQSKRLIASLCETFSRLEDLNDISNI